MAKNPHAVALGSRTSKRKAAASRRNALRGGRPSVTHHPDLLDPVRRARVIAVICERHAAGESVASLARDYGVHARSVYRYLVAKAGE